MTKRLILINATNEQREQLLRTMPDLKTRELPQPITFADVARAACEAEGDGEGGETDLTIAQMSQALRPIRRVLGHIASTNAAAVLQFLADGSQGDGGGS